DHTEEITALAAGLTRQLIHEDAHQIYSAAAGANVGRIEVRHGGEIKRFALVAQRDFHAVVREAALDLEAGLGMTFVGVTNDVADGLVAGENDRTGIRRIESANLAYPFDE